MIIDSSESFDDRVKWLVLGRLRDDPLDTSTAGVVHTMMTFQSPIEYMLVGHADEEFFLSAHGLLKK